MLAQRTVSILHVSGDNPNRGTITRMLKNAGFQVHESLLNSAARKIAQEKPDLVVLNIDLADQTGRELCQQFKKDPMTSSIPVLQLSGKAAAAQGRKAATESGADGYLAEPVDQAELTATIHALLRLRRADEDARISARHWRTTFDAISDGVCLLNHDGTVLRCNRTMADLLKRPFNQIIGQPYSKLVLDAMGSVEAPSLDKTAETRAREVAELAIGNRWFCITADPIIDDYAGLTSAVHTWADITDRKRTDILIGAQKRILEMIATGAPLNGVLVALTQLIEEQSQEIRAAVLLAKDAQCLEFAAAPSLPPRFQKMLNQVPIGPQAGCSGTAAYRREPVFVQDIASDPLWTSAREVALSCDVRAGWATPIFSNTGEILGTLSIYYTEVRAPSPRHRQLVEIATQIAGIAIERARAEESLRRRAEQLAEADRRKDEFLAMLAHELRNPLGAISNALHVIKLQRDVDPSIRRAREVAERQVQHQVRMVDDLLDVSRINHGKIELRKTLLNLPQLVQDTTELHRTSFAEGGIQLVVDLPEHPIWAMADSIRLGQVIDNLLTNSRKFTPRGGSTTVRLISESDSSALVQIADTGIGLDPEILAHLFEPFAQADRSLDRSRGGLGLGLALVRGLVELHGGEVWAESPGPQLGTTFTLRLPTVAAPNEAERPPPGPEPAASPLKVLVVEDNADACETLRDLLQLFGHEVAVAPCGRLGVKMAGTFRPDVVLCDLGLPGIDGYAVAAALRGDPTTASSYLVALSGYGYEEDQRKSREAGFDLHLTKPVDADSLERLLETLRR